MMRILLDTNALIWWLEDPTRLSETAHDVLKATTNSVFCSAVSAVEIAIKLSVGKLTLDGDWETAAHEAGFAFMPLTCKHARALHTLPAIHKDPFDRMLVAQCLVENATLVTSDQLLKSYGIPVLLA